MSDEEDEKPKTFRKFTPEEDEMLRHLVQDEKLTNWVTIASKMKNRNVHQCRDRWRQIGSRRGQKGEWTKTEDEILLSKISELGNHWSLIQKFLPQHTLAQLKARVKYLLKQTNSAYVPPKAIRRPKKVSVSEIKTRSSEHPEYKEKHYYDDINDYNVKDNNMIDLNAPNANKVEIMPNQDISEANEVNRIFEDFQNNDDMGFTLAFDDNDPFEHIIDF